MTEDLILDTAIRYWVLIPLSVVVVLIGILRYFVSKLLRSSQTPDVKMLKEGTFLEDFVSTNIYEKALEVFYDALPIEVCARS